MVHRDKMAQLHAEAHGGQLIRAARLESAARRQGWLAGPRRRLAALAAAILPASGR
jgi:hypothetical protein